MTKSLSEMTWLDGNPAKGSRRLHLDQLRAD